MASCDVFFTSPSLRAARAILGGLFLSPSPPDRLFLTLRISSSGRNALAFWRIPPGSIKKQQAGSPIKGESNAPSHPVQVDFHTCTCARRSGFARRNRVHPLPEHVCGLDCHHRIRRPRAWLRVQDRVDVFRCGADGNPSSRRRNTAGARTDDVRDRSPKERAPQPLAALCISQKANPGPPGEESRGCAAHCHLSRCASGLLM